MANRGARLSEIWESGVLVEHVERIWGISALIVIKVIWGSFGALVSKWPLTQKKKNAGCRAESDRSLGLGEYLDDIYRVALVALVFRVIFGAIQCNYLKLEIK